MLGRIGEKPSHFELVLHLGNFRATNTEILIPIGEKQTQMDKK